MGQIQEQNCTRQGGEGCAAVSECVLMLFLPPPPSLLFLDLLPSPPSLPSLPPLSSFLSQLTALQAELNALHTNYLELKMSTDEDLLSLQQQVKAMQKVRWN